MRTRSPAGLRHQPLLNDLRAFYRTGDEVVVGPLTPGASLARPPRHRRAEPSGKPQMIACGSRTSSRGTYALELVDADGHLVAEEFTTVGAHQGERPVHGFATSFEERDIPAVLEWHRALRSTDRSGL